MDKKTKEIIFEELKAVLEGQDSPKKASSSLFTRIIISIIISAVLGLSTLVGELLYKAPSPDQQKVIYMIQNRLGSPISQE